MKISCALAALLALVACGHPEDAVTAPPDLTTVCPIPLTPQTSIPKGALIEGKLTESLPLWAAEVSFGMPEDERFEGALASVEHDERVLLPNDGVRFHYELYPVKGNAPGTFMPYMLACSYGKDVVSAIDAESRTLLLLPLPTLPLIQCDVTYGVSDGKSMVSSAKCVAGK